MWVWVWVCMFVYICNLCKPIKRGKDKQQEICKESKAGWVVVSRVLLSEVGYVRLYSLHYRRLRAKKSVGV